MPLEELIFDPVSENAANSPLAIMGPSADAAIDVLGMEFPAPPLDLATVGSVDTEGELVHGRRHQNRKINLALEVIGATAGALQLTVATVQAKVAKIARAGGTLQRVKADGQIRIYDLLAADSYDPKFDITYYAGNIAEIVIGLVAKPYARGAEQDLGDNIETVLPALIFTDQIPGDVPALGRLVIDDDQAQDQWWVTWGVQSSTYSAASTAGLFYQAEALTPLTATVAGGVVDNSNLPTQWLGILSTQLAGVGHLTHTGRYRVYARVEDDAANMGTVSVALEWGAGDYRRTSRNQQVNLTRAGGYRIVDLGLITIPAGSPRWEGRILAKSTVSGDDISVDWLILVPADDACGVAKVLPGLASPTAIVASDSFLQTAGALTGKTSDSGHAWLGSGDADDFQVTSGRVSRSVGSDASDFSGRVAVLGPDATAQAARVSLRQDSVDLDGVRQGLVLRYSTADTFYLVSAAWTGIPGQRSQTIEIYRMTATADTRIAGPVTVAVDPRAWFTLIATADPRGRITVWAAPNGAGIGGPVLTAYDAAAATGGTHATGKAGIYDSNIRSNPTARDYDDFQTWVPTIDAAIFAGQSLQIAHDRVTREDSTGAFFTPVSRYEGDYLRVLPSGPEARPARFIVKASRTDPGAGMADPAADDISARLFVTPRYLVD